MKSKRHGTRVALSLWSLAMITPAFAEVIHPTPPIDVMPDCSRQPGSLPDPTRPMGSPDPSMPVEHIIVIMHENHSFDQMLGNLTKPQFYGDKIDGLQPHFSNPDKNGKPVYTYHSDQLCMKDPPHSWNASHKQFNNGLNDQFVTLAHKEGANGGRVMGTFDERELPLYYSFANEFAVGDRYFSSLLGPTFPNRFFFMTGTAFGNIRNGLHLNYKQKTIFEQLNEAGVSWTYYASDVNPLILFSKFKRKNRGSVHHMGAFRRHLRRGKLPKVVFLENSLLLGDEHPPFNFQITQKLMSRNIKALVKSKYWNKSVMFFTYDEHGGFYDHVAPPMACKPDAIEPKYEGNDIRTGFDRLGFRVPFIAIGPYVKRHHVSHEVYDHTSILKFIETKYNIPALTYRDANANNMMDLFDFQNPNFARPKLPKVKINIKKAFQCLSLKRNRGVYPSEKQLKQELDELLKDKDADGTEDSDGDDFEFETAKL